MQNPILNREYDKIIYKRLIEKSVHPFASHWYHCVIKEDERESMNYINRQKGIKRAKKLIRANPNWKHSFQTLIKTRVPCSCYMCGHRRKHFGMTYQEQKLSFELRELE